MVSSFSHPGTSHVSVLTRSVPPRNGASRLASPEPRLNRVLLVGEPFCGGAAPEGVAETVLAPEVVHAGLYSYVRRIVVFLFLAPRGKVCYKSYSENARKSSEFVNFVMSIYRFSIER